ncbi:MAG: ice-binding family protein, partial [Aeromicrobium sp.]
MSVPMRPLLAFVTTGLLVATSAMMIANPVIAATPPLPVNLGTAADYSVLGGSEITNTLTTNLEWNLGVSPGTAITGFPPGVTQRQKYIGIGTPANQATIDAKSAYNDARTRVFTATVSGDIAGETYKSGVYKAAAALDVSANGIVTLDGEDDNNSVFIF